MKKVPDPDDQKSPDPDPHPRLRYNGYMISNNNILLRPSFTVSRVEGEDFPYRVSRILRLPPDQYFSD